MRRFTLLRYACVIALLLYPIFSFAAPVSDKAKKNQIIKKTHGIAVPFIENTGQITNKDVRFYARTFGGTVFVEKNGTLTYSMPGKDNKGAVIREVFTDKVVAISGLDPAPTKVNYFKGNKKENWRSNISTYSRINLGEIAKRIELSLKAYGNNVEKLFTVQPNADPKQIRVTLEGSKNIQVNNKGELKVITTQGPVTFTKPIAYQEIDGKKKSIEAAYAVFDEKNYGFVLGRYDREKPVVIDPLLASTFIGGSGIDEARSIALDTDGNVYIIGYTRSVDYPATAGAYSENCNGEQSDIFISKLDSSLSVLLASTYIGGTGNDYGHVIAFDGNGNIYLTGFSQSSDYPTTSGAYDISYDIVDEFSGYNGFISKFDNSLSTLLASTFIGVIESVSLDYFKYPITFDDSGNVYVAGNTNLSDHPTTDGAYDRSFNGGVDIFISKFDNNLSSLLAGTYFGGASYDWCYSMVLDLDTNVYISGWAMSTDYPLTPGAYDESFNGGMDIFVTKLDSSLSSLQGSTLIGGSDSEKCWSIALDAQCSVYITGGTQSSDYPTTPGGYDGLYNGGFKDGFVSKLDSSLSILQASTFIGGTDFDVGETITLDESGNVYMIGSSSSSDFPTTPGAYNESINTGVELADDCVVSKFDSSLSSLLASTFIGGSAEEHGDTITLDGIGNVYIAGYSDSSDFPTTNNAYDESYNGGYYDAFISKLDNNLSTAAPSCECDLNNDGACNVFDWFMFIEDWGRTDCSGDCECDLNDDGSCNVFDWFVFIEDWGRTDCPVQ